MGIHIHRVEKVGIRERTWIAYLTPNALPQNMRG